MEKRKYTYGNELMEALRFTPEDLAFNQEGLLSETQRQYLFIQDRWIRIGLIIVSMIALTAFAVWDVSFSTKLKILFVPGVIIFPIWQKIYGLWERYAGYMRSPYAEVVEGIIQLDIDDRNRMFQFKLRVQNMRFSLAKREFLAFKNREPYRIYYTPGYNRILSAEHLLESIEQSLDEVIAA